MPRRRTSPWLIALGASLLLHAALVWWLWRYPPKSSPPPPYPVEIQLVEVTPELSPEPATPTRPEPSPGLRPTSRAAPTTSAEMLPPSEELAPDVPLASSPSALQLVPGKLPGAMAVPPPPPEGPRAPEAAANPQELVDKLVQESVGKGKVDRGLVHPYFVDLGKTLVKTWDADRSVSTRGLQGFAEQLEKNSKLWANIWQERAATYGRSGSPLEQNGEPVNLPQRPAAPSDRPHLQTPDLSARQALRKLNREQWMATRRATLRVVQGRDGKLLSVELVSPSNDPHVDKEALADIRSAAERLPPPPLEAIGARDRLTSLWQFELIVSVSPPVPTFSFEFDEALGYVDTRLPLDRRIYKRVRLVAVE